MILYEYEGKKMLSQAGILVPGSQLITHHSEPITLKPPLVLKAQVLSGKRADAGGIIIVDEITNYKLQITNLLGKTINKEKVEKVLVEEKVDIEKEYYVSISYDTDSRAAILSVSQEGGTGIEERGFKTYQIDPINHIVIAIRLSRSGNPVKQDSTSQVFDRESQTESVPLNDNEENGINGIPQGLIQKLINLFFNSDCLLLEVNPLVLTKDGEWIALDAKIKLDDFAKSRHPDWDFPPRAVPGYSPTKREIEAKKIDEGDYRGTAGSSYFDLEGDIAVLSSGGGVSLTALDSLINYGGKPANFTEYSGNPPKEKVVKLTKIVLDKPNIHGLWVIGTVVANFTDIYETLSGLIEGLRQAQTELNTKFDFPIVIRRGGPRVEEAFEMLKQVKDFDLHLQGEETSIAQSAKIMAELAEEYKKLKSKNQK